MKKLLIVILLAINSSIFAVTLSTNGSVTDLNLSPINNHWVYISANDSAYSYTYMDSTLTDSSGAYFFYVNNVPGMQISFKIYTYDCQNNQQSIFVSPPNPTTAPFQICVSQPPTNCNASFITNQDSINNLSYTFTNTSTNNYTNNWYVNNTLISNQTDLSYMFPNTQSINSVCLLIENSTQNCTDSSCTTIVINNCSTSFSDSVNGNTVTFIVNGNPTADIYYWDFGDGLTQNTNNSAITHTYTSGGTYTVNLTAYSIYSAANDTCISYASDVVTIASSSNQGSIYGYVFADSSYLDDGIVELYQKDISNQKMILVDSSNVIMDSSGVYSYFYFSNVHYGDYYLKSKVSSSSVFYNNYFNTWASNNPNKQITQWRYAEAQVLNSSSLLTIINLKKPDISFNNGPGRISGNITNTMGISTIGTTIYLLNQDKLLIKGIDLNPSNGFIFDSLIYGTYYIQPELTNINSIDYEVSISGNTPFADSVQINVDSNNFFVGQNIPQLAKINYNIFPNPFNSEINIDISSQYSKNIILSIYNILGKVLYTNKYEISNNSLIKIDLNELNQGMYFISISDSYTKSIKKIIKH